MAFFSTSIALLFPLAQATGAQAWTNLLASFVCLIACLAFLRARRDSRGFRWRVAQWITAGVLSWLIAWLLLATLTSHSQETRARLGLILSDLNSLFFGVAGLSIFCRNTKLLKTAPITCIGAAILTLFFLGGVVAVDANGLSGSHQRVSLALSIATDVFLGSMFLATFSRCLPIVALTAYGFAQSWAYPAFIDSRLSSVLWATANAKIVLIGCLLFSLCYNIASSPLSVTSLQRRTQDQVNGRIEEVLVWTVVVGILAVNALALTWLGVAHIKWYGDNDKLDGSVVAGMVVACIAVSGFVVGAIRFFLPRVWRYIANQRQRPS